MLPDDHSPPLAPVERISSAIDKLGDLIAACLSVDPLPFAPAAIVNAPRMLQLVGVVTSRLWERQYEALGEESGIVIELVSRRMIEPALVALDAANEELSEVQAALVAMLTSLCDAKGKQEHHPFAEALALQSMHHLLSASRAAQRQQASGNIPLFIGLVRHAMPKLPHSSVLAHSTRAKLVDALAGYLVAEVTASDDPIWRRVHLPMLITLAEELMLTEAQSTVVGDWVMEMSVGRAPDRGSGQVDKV